MSFETSSLLNEETIVRRLREAPPDTELDTLAQAYAGLRQAAVLVPLLYHNEQWHLLFTRRTETVNSHKGQVSFPGGAADPEDDSPEATALREAYEEIGLRAEDIHILGRMQERPTISRFLVTPVVARVPWPYPFRLSPNEVGRVFTIPLDWLADPAHREVRPRAVPEAVYERVIYYQEYDGEILWGASAHITLGLLRALQLTP